MRKLFKTFKEENQKLLKSNSNFTKQLKRIALKVLNRESFNTSFDCYSIYCTQEEKDLCNVNELFPSINTDYDFFKIVSSSAFYTAFIIDLNLKNNNGSLTLFKWLAYWASIKSKYYFLGLREMDEEPKLKNKKVYDQVMTFELIYKDLTWLVLYDSTDKELINDMEDINANLIIRIGDNKHNSFYRVENKFFNDDIEHQLIKYGKFSARLINERINHSIVASDL